MNIGIVVRPADVSDLESLLMIEREAWSEGLAFTEDHFRSHLEVFKDFPEGIQIAEAQGVAAGNAVAQLMKYDLENPIPDWYTATNDGFLRRTHDPEGNVLYGVSLSVSPRFSSLRVGKAIIEAAKRIVVKHQLTRFILGSRVPRFHLYAEKMTISDYIRAKRGLRFLDPELEFYNRCKLQVVKILPNYFDDPESLNYGILMVWDNPDLSADRP
jgi:ribosomal protein S18 acetylase RimI-like enzyme